MRFEWPFRARNEFDLGWEQDAALVAAFWKLEENSNRRTYWYSDYDICLLHMDRKSRDRLTRGSIFQIPILSIKITRDTLRSWFGSSGAQFLCQWGFPWLGFRKSSIYVNICDLRVKNGRGFPTNKASRLKLFNAISTSNNAKRPSYNMFSERTKSGHL